MTGPSRLEQEAALRRALTQSSPHGGDSIVHTRVQERVDAAALIHAGRQRPTSNGET